MVPYLLGVFYSWLEDHGLAVGTSHHSELRSSSVLLM
jgi:hypothetical protein